MASSRDKDGSDLAATRLFLSADRDGSGSLDVVELRQLLREQGKWTDEERFNMLIRGIDLNDDGKVSQHRVRRPTGLDRPCTLSAPFFFFLRSTAPFHSVPGPRTALAPRTAPEWALRPAERRLALSVARCSTRCCGLPTR